MRSPSPERRQPVPEHPHRSSIAVLSGLALYLASGPTGAQQNQALRIDSEAMKAESAPAGFSSLLTGKGRTPAWQVLEDRSAPAGAKVVAETSKDRTDYRFPLLVLDGF